MGNYFLSILDVISAYEKQCCKQRYISKFNIQLKKQKFKNIADIYNINKALTFIALKKELEFATVFKNY